ncbi:MAG: NAD(P)/FAD-dependent oxidoreductase, partial [Chloroflexota bacterium]|nr:NAD(P)/FAD-dependent oxidoreductase [Chloroflexota bacterium]
MRQEKADSLVPVHNKVSKPYVDSADILIVGNGIAGLTAAVEARGFAPDMRIVMITDQNHPTINTPALKQFAIGKLTREQLLAYPPGTERTQGIHLIHGHVEEINAQGKFVSLAGGRGFGYGTLLIATGSAPNSLPAKLPGRDFDGVITLHRLRDYLNLRRRLGEVREAVVIGGGSHAIETVMGLLHWGIHVHWFIRSQTFLPRMLDETASTLVLERVRQAGATIYTGTEAMGIVGRVGSVAGVVTNQQQFIPCQLVAACTGTKAVTTLAEHCNVPMKHKNGILVDERLRSSVRDIYVAGDAAALKNPLTGEYEPRAQWYAAVLQGRMAGAMMTDHREQVKQTFGVPWHATQLGAFSMLMVGNPLDTSAGVTPLTGTSRGGYRRMTLLDDRLVGYL